MRKIIQISGVSANSGVRLVALCDDGTLWAYRPGTFIQNAATGEREDVNPSSWTQIPGIPE